MSLDKITNPENIKKGITVGLILFIVVVVYFSGPVTAFYITEKPAMAHKPGSKDINVTIVFYKERYEAIGTISARMMKLPTNPTASDVLNLTSNPTAMLSAESNADINCWARPYGSDFDAYGNPIAFYSYDYSAYMAPNSPDVNNPSAAAFYGQTDFNILSYGYMWDAWDQTIALPQGQGSRYPGDENYVYKFMDWMWDTDLMYYEGAAGAVIHSYYGYGYNYAGTFSCNFQFRGLTEGIYIGVVPYINGIAVDETGYNVAGLPAKPTTNTRSSIVAIKDKNTESGASTDLNFVDPGGASRIYFSIPNGAFGSSSATFITIDINTDSVTNPTGAVGGDMSLGGQTTPPRFTFGSDVSGLTLTGAATLKMFYTGFITDSQASGWGNRLRIFSKKADGTWAKLTTTVDTAADSMTTSITDFI